MLYYFSEKGIIKFKKEVRDLEERLKQLQSKTQSTVENGGDQWHDNPALYDLMSQLRATNSHLADYYDILRQCRIINYPKSTDVVYIGSSIMVQDGDKQIIYHIAGYGESYPNKQVLAYNTPIAKSLIGKKKGDKVNMILPKGQKLITILNINSYESPK